MTKDDCYWDEELVDIKADYPSIVKDKTKF